MTKSLDAAKRVLRINDIQKTLILMIFGLYLMLWFKRCAQPFKTVTFNFAVKLIYFSLQSRYFLSSRFPLIKFGFITFFSSFQEVKRRFTSNVSECKVLTRNYVAFKWKFFMLRDVCDLFIFLHLKCGAICRNNPLTFIMKKFAFIILYLRKYQYSFFRNSFMFTHLLYPMLYIYNMFSDNGWW